MIAARKIIRLQNIIILILFFYSITVGEVIIGAIGIILFAILLKLIPCGTDKHVKNPLLWIISIIILAYFFFIGELLPGLITVFLIAILWLLAYRLIDREKGKKDNPGKITIGITFLTLWYAFGALIGIYRFFSGQQIIVLGITLSDIPAQGIRMFFILIDIYLIYGFIKLHKLAWIIAIIYGFYGLLNLSINIISFSLISPGMTVPIFGIFLNIIIILYLLDKADSFTNKIMICNMMI